MMTVKHFITISFVLSFMLSGCQTIGKQAEQAQSISENLVMCTKCKTAWVEIENPDGDVELHSYKTEEITTCPDCETAATHFFKTRKFQHTCKSCGDTLEHCKFMKWQVNKISF